MLYVFLPPEWLSNSGPIQKECTFEEALKLNEEGYNVYYYPNHPEQLSNPNDFITGSDVTCFEYVFVDFDLKDGKYQNKEEFLTKLGTFSLVPTSVVDSGNGLHVYWKVSDLDAMSFLRLNRRLMRLLSTDPAVSKIKQLMRAAGTVNTKKQEDFKLCEEIFTSDSVYSCEQLDAALPIIILEDEQYCKTHFEKTYKIQGDIRVDDKIPLKFAQLIRSSAEAKAIWSGETDDRSKSDYRLGHLMFANGFTREEAMSVLVNSAKALGRAPSHRIAYAENIVDKIWTFESVEDKKALGLSSSVKDILSKAGTSIKGTRFPCWRFLDATHHGFRLGQVIGLVAGSGVGKTAMALNMFEGFVQNNPDYDHFFVPLEQPANEIADRWKTMCGSKEHLYEKVHIISNYDEEGAFRHLSFEEIKTHILTFQKTTGRKVGCVVIDHIGALKKKGKDGENQDLMDICHSMKAFAVQTNTMLVMQSQAPREKAGIGDLELNKDAAYGTVYFESYCDYLVTIWQPLKRCYSDMQCPTVTAYKFCKIRHKKQHKDEIKEDVCYRLFFDPETEHLRELTQDEEKSFDFFNNKATNARKKDRKTDIVPYKSLPWSEGEVTGGKISSNTDLTGARNSEGLPN